MKHGWPNGTVQFELNDLGLCLILGPDHLHPPETLAKALEEQLRKALQGQGKGMSDEEISKRVKAIVKKDSEWHYIVSGEDEDEPMIWARFDPCDPYAHTREVLLCNGDLSVRLHSNERAPATVVAQVGAPVEVVAEVLRRAGWTVTAPVVT